MIHVWKYSDIVKTLFGTLDCVFLSFQKNLTTLKSEFLYLLCTTKDTFLILNRDINETKSWRCGREKETETHLLRGRSGKTKPRQGLTGRDPKKILIKRKTQDRDGDRQSKLTTYCIFVKNDHPLFSDPPLREKLFNYVNNLSKKRGIRSKSLGYLDNPRIFKTNYI